GAREPDLLAVRPPGEAPQIGPPAREGSAPSRSIDEDERSERVRRLGMIAQGQQISRRGNAHRIEVAGRLVERLADRKLDPDSPPGQVGRGELGAVWTPVREGDVIEDVSRRPPAQRHTGEHRRLCRSFEKNRELSGSRHGGDLSRRRTQRTRLGTLRPYREDANRLPVPGGAVDGGV